MNKSDTSKEIKFVRMDEVEYHVFQSMRRAKKALPIKRISALTGVKKRKLKRILERFNDEKMLFSPEKNEYGLQGLYNGVPLLRYEYEAMKEIEQEVGKPIPLIDKVDLSFGFVVDQHRVKELGLYKAGIDNLPDSIGKLKTLEVLDLGYNNLTELPISIRDLTKITRLNLMWNKFTEIPHFIRKIVTVNELEFQGNNLTDLPDWINILTFMHGMDFSHNKLNKLNESICDHPTLKYLDLWNNQLTKLPKNLGKLLKLERLILSKNKLASLPDSLSKLENLKILAIDDNQFKEFPDFLKKLRSLEKVDITYNKISEIPQNTNYEIIFDDQKEHIGSMHEQHNKDMVIISKNVNK